MDKEWLRALLGPHDRMVGRLRFQHAGTCWRVWNLRDNGAWIFIGSLDNINRHPFVEPDESLVQRAKELAARRHEEVVL